MVHFNWHICSFTFNLMALKISPYLQIWWQISLFGNIETEVGASVSQRCHVAILTTLETETELFVFDRANSVKFLETMFNEFARKTEPLAGTV